VRALVVDASVVAKWFLAEDGSPAARRLISPRRKLIAPELVGVELANVIWKRVQREELDSDNAGEILADFQQVAVHSLEIVASGPYLPAALSVAMATGRTIYDCLYLSLAMNRQTRLITADKRFAQALSGSPFSKFVRMLA
jgi:predicted nucleic acid-binding protein